MATPSKTKDSNKVKNYFKGVKAEMKKVIWPSKKELINYTGVVIFISITIALIVGLLDFIILQALSLII